MNYKDYNDNELVYLIRERDENALDLVIRKYEPVIKSLAFYYVKKYNNLKLDSEDLSQEARLTLYKCLLNYDNKDVYFYTYAVFCIKRCMFTIIKKSFNDTNNSYYSVDDDDNYLQISDNSEELLSLYEDNLFINKIINFKNSLDFIDSLIFELKYNYFSYKDISNLLEIDIKKIDNRLSKIRNKLKNYLIKD